MTGYHWGLLFHLHSKAEADCLDNPVYTEGIFCWQLNAVQMADLQLLEKIIPWQGLYYGVAVARKLAEAKFS